MIGYPTSCLLNKLPEYICPICNNVFRQPIQTSCGHRFCKYCINELITNSTGEISCKQCILEKNDSIGIIKHDEIYDDRAFNKELFKLNVKCYLDGCTWKGIYSQLEKHILNCEFVKGICILCETEFLKNSDHRCNLKEKCFLACSYKFSNEDDKLLSESICRHSLSLMKRFNNESIEQQTRNESLSSQISKLFNTINSIQRKNSITNLQNQTIPAYISFPDNTYNAESIDYSYENSLLTNLQRLFNQDNFKQTLIEYMTVLAEPIITTNSSINDQLLNQLIMQVEEYRSNGIEMETKSKSFEAMIKDLRQKLIIAEAKNKDLEIRLNIAEQTSYDGTLIWAINDFAKKREDAVNGRNTSYFSVPFYSSKYGYKMSVRIYPNGDGIGKGTHLSLFFVIMKGNYDALLSWPFKHQVTLYFLDQSGKNHIKDAFKSDPTSSSFRQPASEMNIASGCPMFVPLAKLYEQDQTFIINDTAFVKVVVTSNDI